MPAGLLLLSGVPVAAGAIRVAELASDPTVTPANLRFVADPVPVVAHILSVTTFSLAGALQFAPSLRRRRSGWHRWSGRIVAPAGVVAAVTGIWMTVRYDLPPHDNDLLGAFRLVAGTAMAGALVTGANAARRKRFARHGAWMARGYALGLGAGTQALILAPWIALLGEPEAMVRAWLMGAGWALNLVVAEWVIRSRRRGAVTAPPTRSATGALVADMT